jgi:acylphosphatase
MVMFRDFVQRSAKALGIVGVVKNLDDGTVEIIAQGDRESLEKFIAQLHTGSFLAHVVRVAVVWRKPTETFTGFTVSYL